MESVYFVLMAVRVCECGIYNKKTYREGCFVSVASKDHVKVNQRFLFTLWRRLSILDWILRAHVERKVLLDRVDHELLGV